MSKCRICGTTDDLVPVHHRRDTYRSWCKEHYNEYKKEANRNSNDDYYSVYYLPEEHYCGVTTAVLKRIKEHSRTRNVDGWRVLFCSKDKKEAYYHESLFHSVLCMEGLRI